MAATFDVKIDTKATAMQLAETMFGDGIQVVSAQYTGAFAACSSGGQVDDATQADGSQSEGTAAPNSAASINATGSVSPEDIGFTTPAALPVFDGAAIQTDFVPEGNCLTLHFALAANEASEQDNLILDKDLAIWVNGEKLSVQKSAPGMGDGHSVHPPSTPSASHAPAAEASDGKINGLGNVLTLQAPVKPGEVNTPKIGIAGAAASAIKTNLMISGHSLPLPEGEAGPDGAQKLPSPDNVTPLGAGPIHALGKIDLGDLPKPAIHAAAERVGALGSAAKGDLLGTLYLTDPLGEWIDGKGPDHAGAGGNVQTGAEGQRTVDDPLSAPDFAELDLNDEGQFHILYDPDHAENGAVQVLDEAGQVTGTFPFASFRNAPAPCFTPGTLITTDRGDRLVEDLQTGDRVLTRDGGFQALRWIGQRALSGLELQAAPHLNPVRIAAGTLGSSLPDRDLVVSPQHRMLVARAKAEIMFGEQEVLIAATHLVGQPGVTQESPSEGVTYIHLLLDQHEILRANGAWSESYQPGALSIAGWEEGPRRELLTLFPELARAEVFPSARITLRRHEARLLMGE